MEEKFNYEKSIAELEEIIKALNDGNCSLDESLELYTRGVKLVTLCNNKLKEVEQKITIVNNGEGSDGIN